MTQDLKAQAQQMRTCADAVESAANVFAQVQQFRSQAADLTAQADALEKQAHDALENTGCYHPAPAKVSAPDANTAAPSASAPVPTLLWDGNKFVE